jgi:hypothetical protein
VNLIDVIYIFSFYNVTCYNIDLNDHTIIMEEIMKKIKNNVIRIDSDVAHELEKKAEKKIKESNVDDD